MTSVPPSPYRGLVPFSIEDAPFFFGRGRTTSIVRANLIASRLTLLYGSSGVGKSSLLRAGVAYRMRLEAENDAINGGPNSLVVVFSTWRDDPIGCLRSAIAEAVEALPRGENAASAMLRDDLPLDEALAMLTEKLQLELFVILDQFEEYFLYNKTESGPRSFAEEFPRVLGRRDLPVNFLVAIREDALAHLDAFKGRIPHLFQNYLRVKHLDMESARQAIERPLERYCEIHGDGEPEISIEPELVDAVLDQVRTGRVLIDAIAAGTTGEADGGQGEERIETPFLQLVMQRIWMEETREDSKVLRASTLVRLGGAGEIVRTHLNESLETLTGEEREIAAAIFRHLVTPSGTKIALSATDLAAWTGCDEQVIAILLEKLSGGERRILRPLPRVLDGPTRFEIFHDVLAPAIFHWRRRFVEERERSRAEEERRRAEEEHQRAEEEHQRAEREERRANEQARLARRLRWSVAGLAAVLLMVLVVVILGQAGVIGQQDKIMRSRELAADAVRALREDPDRSRLIALAAMLMSPTPEAEDAVRRASAASPAILYRDTDAKVLDVAYSPDGATFAVGEMDGTLSLWTFHGRKLWSEKGHDSWIHVVAYSPDAGWLVSASEDGKAVVWDRATGEPLQSLSIPGAIPLKAASFHPREDWLAVGGSDGLIRSWSWSGDRWTALDSRVVGSEISSLEFSRSGRLLAAGSADGRVTVFDLESGDESELGRKLWSASCLPVVDRAPVPVLSVAFSWDEKFLGWVGEHSRAVIWDLEGDACQVAFTGHTDTVADIAFDESGWVGTAGWDRTVRLWDPVSGEERLVLRGHSGPVRGISFRRNAGQLASGGLDSTVRVWDWAEGAAGSDSLAFRGHTGHVTSASFSRDGKLLATSGGDGTVRVWDSHSGKQTHHLDQTDWVRATSFSPGGDLLVAAVDDGDDGKVALWELSTDSTRDLLNSEGWVLDVDFSPSGVVIAAATQQGTVYLLDPDGETAPRVLSGHEGWVYALDFAPDSRHLASASGDGSVIVWDVESGEALRRLWGYGEQVVAIEYDTSGDFLAAAFLGGSGVVWPTEGTDHPIHNLLSSHLARLTDLVFSPDGRIATSSRDGTIKIRNVQGKDLLTFQNSLETAITALAFSPDGKRLAAVGAYGMVMIHHQEKAELMQDSARRITRYLWAPECEAFFGDPECPSWSRGLREVYEAKRLAVDREPLEVVRSRLESAVALSPGLGVRPDEEARRFMARAALDEANYWGHFGDTRQAVADIERATQLDRSLVTPIDLNRVCWLGALWGESLQVMSLCDDAIEKADEGYVGQVYDSRGVARAAAGDLGGAIEDLQAFLDWVEKRPRAVDSQLVAKRRDWMQALDDGINPITDEVRAELLRE